MRSMDNFWLSKSVELKAIKLWEVHDSFHDCKSAINASAFVSHYLKLPNCTACVFFPSGYVIVHSLAKMVLSVVWKGSDASLQHRCLHSVGTSANLFLL